MSIIHLGSNHYRVHFRIILNLVFSLIVISAFNVLPAFADEIRDKYVEIDGIKFIYVPPGSFYMGSIIAGEKEANNNENTHHEVTLTEGYFLSQYEITQKQWKRVMGDNPSRFSGCDDCPVDSVSWSDATDFVNKLNMQKDSLIVVDGFNFACEDYEIKCQVPEAPEYKKVGKIELNGYFVVIPFWGDREGLLTIEIDEETAKKFSAGVMDEPIDQIDITGIPRAVSDFCMFATTSMLRDFAKIGIDINFIPYSTHQAKVLSVSNQLKEAMAFKLEGKFGHLSINFAYQIKGTNVGKGRYRLPTEAEWEYAERAGADTAYYFGSNPENIDKYAWVTGNSPDGKTHPVGLKLPNAWNFYDMQGNVSEWVQDWYDKQSSQSTTNPIGPLLGDNKVLKGCNKESSQEDCRSAGRESDYGGNCSTGFRLLYVAP